MVAAHAESLIRRDPTGGGRLHPVAGGWLVLAGPGMYVNRALAAGIARDPADGRPTDGRRGALSAAELEVLVTESRALGMVPAVEVTPATGEASVDRLRSAGFAHDPTRDVATLTRSIGSQAVAPIEAPDDVAVRPVGSSPERLRLWQETSILGWGHATEVARRASDAYAAAAHATPGEHLVLAFDARPGSVGAGAASGVDPGAASGVGRPIGCATTTVRAGLALLGGMATVPAQRRRGVQAALLRHRVERAAELGCDLAVATASAGSASERNLRRHGFAPLVVIETWVLPDDLG